MKNTQVLCKCAVCGKEFKKKLSTVKVFNCCNRTCLGKARVQEAYRLKSEQVGEDFKGWLRREYMENMRSTRDISIEVYGSVTNASTVGEWLRRCEFEVRNPKKEAEERRKNAKAPRVLEKHGLTKTRLYREWVGIRARCRNKNWSVYERYGAKGISVCDEWDKSFISFKEWALLNGYNDNLSIDRIDVNGNYCPNNCRWVGQDIQNVNQNISKRNKTGVTGVDYRSKTNRYVAQIGYDKKTHYIGSYSTLEEAIKARRDAEKKHYPSL